MLSTTTKARIKLGIKAVLTVLVLGFVVRHVQGTWLDLQERGQSIRVDWPWVGLAVGLYLAGLASYGTYFWRILEATPTPASWSSAVRAYLISHLGKYVPGKAMVVVMRVGLVAPSGVNPASATFATLYETLVMMACGALVAGLGFSVESNSSIKVALFGSGEIDAPLGWVGLSLGLVFLVVVWPPSFRRLAGLTRLPFPKVSHEALPRLKIGLLGEGMLWSLAGWVLLGLSQVAVIRAILPEGLAPGVWPLVIASVALATVAGFVVPISPGGLGVREWVLWTALGSAIDRDLAVVAALVLRLAWVAGEILGAAVLLAFRPAQPRPSLP